MRDEENIIVEERVSGEANNCPYRRIEEDGSLGIEKGCSSEFIAKHESYKPCSLVIKWVPYDGIQLPYFVQKPENPNGATVVYVEGGPVGFLMEDWKSNEEIEKHPTGTLLKNGYTIIFPQETLRTGYGWKHFKKGLGGAANTNCKQILAIVQSAFIQGDISNLDDVHVYGMSYGGFQAMAHAVGLSTFEKQPFMFRSCVASAALAQLSFHSLFMENFFKIFFLPKGLTSDQEVSWRKAISPSLYRTVQSPLLVLHGRNDHRCPVGPIEEFERNVARDRYAIQFEYHSLGHTHHPNEADIVLEWLEKHRHHRCEPAPKLRFRQKFWGLHP